MPTYTGPSLISYLLVLGFLSLLFIGFYFIKKNRHLISQKINSKRRMKVSDITLLGQGDRALILSLDNKDYLFISGKNSGALLIEVKKTNEFITIATTKPETMLGDTAVAVNAKDKRYKKFVGKNVILP